jgi:lysophospholipase L1-like esterase
MTLSRSISALFAVVVAVLLIICPWGSALAIDPAYVALGDSIEAGFGATPPVDTHGWVWLFWAYLKIPQNLGTDAALVNLGTPGATVRDIQRKELHLALAAIVTHAPVVISWGGGGNDLINFITSHQALSCRLGNVSCLRRLNALLNEAEQTIDHTINALRVVAGPDTKILLRTQYNPFLKVGCDPTQTVASLTAIVLEGEAPPLLTRGLNDRIRDVAAKYGARVIEIYQVFALNADAFISPDCIHPSDAGHQTIADAAQLAF